MHPWKRLTNLVWTRASAQGFILAMLANEIASRPACDKLTYGPVRAEVLSALFSTVLILVLSLLLVYSAICRIIGELNRNIFSYSSRGRRRSVQRTVCGITSFLHSGLDFIVDLLSRMNSSSSQPQRRPVA